MNGTGATETRLQIIIRWMPASGTDSQRVLSSSSRIRQAP